MRRVAESSDEVACLVLRGWAGSRLEGRDGLVCRGEKTQESTGLQLGVTRVGANGLAKGVRLRNG